MGCFGTKEFNANSNICKACERYEECKDISLKKKNWKVKTGITL